MDTAIIRSRILDLAIRGKLVEQDPSEGTAEELLKEIGKQRGKTIESISDDVPFEIPDSWSWIKGADLFYEMETKKPSGDKFKYIDIDSIDNIKCKVKEAKILLSKDAPSRASRKTIKGDTLFSMVRPYLKNIAMVVEDDCIASTGFFVCHTIENINNKFCYYLMMSRYVVEGLNSFMKGDNSPSIKKGNVENYKFPLPPLAEQKRIVERVEELLKQVDAIETAQIDIKQISSILRSRVLDKAMNGELTSSCVEKWESMRIGDICKTSSGGTPQTKNPNYYGGNVPWLQSGELHQKYIYDTSKKITQEGYDNSSAKYYPKNSVLIALYGATVGEVAITKIKTTSNQAICAIFPSEKLNEEYLYYFLKMKKSAYVNMASGGAQPNISQEKVKNTTIPFPPLAEQKRIVAKIEEIFAEIDHLTK